MEERRSAFSDIRVALFSIMLSFFIFGFNSVCYADGPIEAVLQPTGDFELHTVDGASVFCQEFALVKVSDGSSLSIADANMQSIEYSINGADPVTITPNEDTSLWLSIRRDPGDYVYSFTDRSGVAYQAELSLTDMDLSCASITAADTANNTYLKYTMGDLDLSNYDSLIQIKPDESYEQVTDNHDSYLWFKLKDGSDADWQPEDGKHVFLLLQNDNWYRGIIDWGAEPPEVLAKDPQGENEWFDETRFYPCVIKEISSEKRYFLRVRFRDWDGGLTLNDTGLAVIGNSIVSSQDGDSIIDKDVLNYADSLSTELQKSFIDDYLLVKNTAQHTADLFIPITLPQTATTYTVNLNANIVRNTYGEGNEAIAWSFTTMAIPSISGIFPKSVPEDYSKNQYILISGEFFYTEGNMEVLFGDTEADRVQIVTDKNGDSTLKVYLPSGSDKLDAGLYDVTVLNSETCEETLMGELSVIPSLEIDNQIIDGKKTVKTTRFGNVKEAVEFSENMLVIKSEYCDRKYLSLDMDELMGDSLRKVIQVRGEYGDMISELETFSKWADVTFYKVELLASKDDGYINIGRPSLWIENSLKQKLAGKIIRSDLIEVTTENIDTDYIKISFPFQNCNTDELVVMRYDETLRSWFEINYAINLIDRKVQLESANSGYFIAVEKTGNNWR